MSASYPTKLLLAFRSGDVCAFPKCERFLTVDGDGGGSPVVTGEAAHIAGEHQGAARYDSGMTDEQRNHYANLIFLCGDHHTQIDKQAALFTVGKLVEIKGAHEATVRQSLQAAFASVGFPELAQATEWIAKIDPAQSTTDYKITAPDAKITKNELTNRSRVTIAMGLGVAREVRAFVEAEARLDSDYPERLKAGFLEEYYRLRRGGQKGDDLFDLMCRFAQKGMKEQSKRSAALAVLVYLFEACEVFEK